MRKKRSLTRLPITVAMAAPAAPMPRTWIKTGSRTIFTTEPPTLPSMDRVEEPSQRSRLECINGSMIAGALTARTI